MRECWLETELFSIRHERSPGGFSRRLWREQVGNEFWKSLPSWFKTEARPFLDPKYKPRKKVTPLSDSSIMEAIESAANETLH